jgi:outer membrane biosynthesis protein TonB
LLSRLVALSAFLVAVALGLWLLDAPWAVVVLVMVLAYAIAATIEWLSWRQDRPQAATGQQAPAPEPASEPDESGGLWLLRGEQPVEQEKSERVEEAAPVEEPDRVEEPEAPAEEPAAPTEPEGPREPEAPPPVPPPAPLRPVPPPTPKPEPPPIVAARPAAPQEAPVVDLRRRAGQPREWNLWDLERIAREEAKRDPRRAEEWSYLFLHLRRFATADGVLPTEFDGLVRESFGGLLDRAQRA